MTVARNRAVDVLRRPAVEQRKLREVAVLAVTDGDRTGDGRRRSWTTGCG